MNYEECINAIGYHIPPFLKSTESLGLHVKSYVLSRRKNDLESFFGLTSKLVRN